MIIYFLSANKIKIHEVTTILDSPDITVQPIYMKINEIQSNDMNEIAIDKVLKAFQETGRPVLVEQTGLLIREFGDLPGGLTQIIWNTLRAEKFSKIFSELGSAEVTAKTVIAYCDGKQIHTFEGETAGHIVYPPRGDMDFQWDCVFEPVGYDMTFAELGDRKNEISMRRIALDKLSDFLEGVK